MIALALLLALQPVDTFKDGQKRPPVDTSQDETGQGFDRYQFGIGPDLGFWSTQLGGTARVDGPVSGGTSIDLIKDLNLPPQRGIPIYGGGTLYFPISHDPADKAEILFSAEYWSREWKGTAMLSKNVVFGEATFSPGTSVDSRLRLGSLDLAASIRSEDLNHKILGAVSLLLRGTEADLKLSSPGRSDHQEFGDLLWGLGLFGEYRPFDILLAGVSLKGYTTFGSDFEAAMADLRTYAGAEWKFFRLEGGFRFIPYAQSSSGHSLHADLSGPYVDLSLFLRF